ncbi:MAG: helix-turn-helix domain-containing protein [Planctomycetes bacterium]|nr:helix-turn-helix domain-containing protein [Planctomycetota bacterium]
MSYDLCSIANYGGEGCNLCVVEMTPQPDTDGLHKHDCEELVLVKNGVGWHVTETGKYSIAAGDVFLVKRGAMHGYAQMDGVNLVNVLFLPENLDLPLADLVRAKGYQAFFAAGAKMTDDFRMRDILSLSGDALASAVDILAAMANEQAEKDDGYRLSMMAHFLQLQVVVSRAAWAPEVRKKAHAMQVQRIAKAMRFMEYRHVGPVWSHEIAKAVHMSPRSLERLCRQALGTSPIDYLIDIRLAKAVEKLRTTSDSITAIAYDSGFNDNAYFTRVFRKKFQCTPREYRKRLSGEESRKNASGSQAWLEQEFNSPTAANEEPWLDDDGEPVELDEAMEPGAGREEGVG